jgi:hypothetical protein
MTTSGAPIQDLEGLEKPVRIGLEAYTSERYARAEQDRLWRKTWLQAGRIEDIPEVGDFITYDILSDSILIVRSAPDRVKAFYNVCPHGGARWWTPRRGSATPGCAIRLGRSTSIPTNASSRGPSTNSILTVRSR